MVTICQVEDSVLQSIFNFVVLTDFHSCVIIIILWSPGRFDDPITAMLTFGFCAPRFSGFFSHLVLCYEYKISPTQEVHLLSYWPSASDAILEDSGNLRHWGITGRGRSYGYYPWSSDSSFLFASCLSWGGILLHKLLHPWYSTSTQSHTIQNKTFSP